MRSILQVIIILMLASNLQATIHRVTVTGAPGTYGSLNAAVTAATPGDTIHVEPGTYATLFTSIKNNLTFIGNGLNLGQFPNQQADTNRSKIDKFYLPGINTKVYGLDIDVLHCHSNDTNSLIQFCKINSVNIYSHCNNTQILDCSLGLLNSTLSSLDLKDSTEGTIIQNCHFLSNTKSDTMSSGNSFMNCVFELSTISQNQMNQEFSNCTISNCIFKYGSYTNFNSTFINNIACQGAESLPTGNGNVSGVDPADLFDNPTSTEDVDQQIKPGYVNQNIGMFAGSTPFRLAYMPPIPSIYQFIVPPVINTNTGTITISTKTNQ